MEGWKVWRAMDIRGNCVEKGTDRNEVNQTAKL